MILISEIFGPTIQGEGVGIGMPTVFVRTAGCDFRCSWCDTLHAVDKKYRSDWYEMSAAQVLSRVEELSGGVPLLITLSGGNPATQDLSELIKLGKAKGYRFAMETQGSVAAPWFSMLDQITFSPKPPSSKMKFIRERFEHCLISAGEIDKSIKIVISGDEDLQWVNDIRDRYADIPLYLQPCNEQLEGEPDQAILAKNIRDLVDEVIRRRWYDVKVLPQLHVYLWGNATGV
ncbi:7-carboxy-7-deazaguanine synthase QueE [Vibrio sp. SCSIO 43137]|uniref:7-carboxy-7-deazaguanine synthase QueE n=1 Tax=Vibrio sp. SCSIO 43137 TaxID=3021011 RepID=UPI00230803C5|nr:7-carboxy-7-deazaguanine synthase QueE [Vibrio sp. SCSIO 43137]WCE29548.1 7-carboxy-7-deazaguanine synthase QueE [Vibrio sp. SCSIO 43137]